jgi:wyosine [tRNA(Phe)-imidazoG37] synthetase (radical SAM superfamily)
VDNPILKIDAPTDAQAALVNRPAAGYHVAHVVEALRRFEGDFVLQTMFLRGPSWATEDWVKEWMELVRELRPREVMVYTIDRETPMKGLGKYTVEEMRALVQPLLTEGITIQIKG